jgi:hypothetical protein
VLRTCRNEMYVRDVSFVSRGTVSGLTAAFGTMPWEDILLGCEMCFPDGSHYAGGGGGGVRTIWQAGSC